MEIRNFNLYFHKPAHSGEAGERALPVDSAIGAYWPGRPAT